MATRETASPGAIPLGLHVVAGPFDLAIPAGWHTRQGLANPSGNFALVYLGPDALPSACRQLASGSGVCGPWPLFQLGPDGIVVAVRLHGMPGSQPPPGGDPVTIAGLPGRRIIGAPDQACIGIGGSQSIDVVLPSVPETSGWMSIDACVAGGGMAAADEAFDAILASATIAPEPSPSESELKPLQMEVASLSTGLS